MSSNNSFQVKLPINDLLTKDLALDNPQGLICHKTLTNQLACEVQCKS